MFPNATYFNIGQKLDFIDKNVFTNTFCREAYDRGTNPYQKEMMRSYFNIEIPPEI